ncbi:MAG: YggS family pyridoxal phosphate-dependent enzyme [Caldilineaceae bacterium]|nr:YggS family pyridoxal phosphate-dependent enzyme [Caldilineaceae bacterium]
MVRQRIAAAAQRVGRTASQITLVAVSKTQPFEAIETAYAAGQRDFGENRVEELWPKVEQAKQQGLADIRWHLIGTIQSRKSANAIGPFALIHSVDRLKLANRLNCDAIAAGTVMEVLLEVNVSGEESKHGFTPQELLAAVPECMAYSGVRVAGLMTMAPFVAEAEETRPVFRRLRELRERVTLEHPGVVWPELSMGMTNDFEVAVEEGATLVRVGSAIFGARQY